MEITSALDKLFSLHQFGIKLGLDNIKKLLKHLGNPEKSLRVYHIAGSNGKGSTASFIASILMEAGYKTGLYTSPHLVRFNERIRINSVEIPDEYVASFVSSLDKYIDENEPTFFELTTAMAFKYFAEQKVDYAVIETGLGGRLDATNTINDPVASVITTISLEHTQILGDTLEKIATEKAGIIKDNSNVFCGILKKEAMSVISEKCAEKHAELFNLGDYIQINSNSAVVNMENFAYNVYETSLKGNHQLVNAALAVCVLWNTLDISNLKIFHAGISNVIKNSGIQGRYEIYNQSPKVIFDAAHNPEGIQSFVETFKNEFKLYNKTELIIGVMRDKNIEGMLSLLGPYFHKIYAVSIDYERAANKEEIIEAGRNVGVGVIGLDRPEEYLNSFIETKKQNCLVVLGSIYVLGNIKSKILYKLT